MRSEIKRALGDEDVARIASKLGLTEDEAADQLERTAVPKAIDEASPQGHLPSSS